MNHARMNHLPLGDGKLQPSDHFPSWSLTGGLLFVKGLSGDMNAASDANMDMFNDRSRRRDDLLFAQPKSCWGDCPICFLPQPHDIEKQVLTSCCSKMICMGCWFANMMRGQGSLKPTCPFCRHPSPVTQAELDANIAKRLEVNDPVTMRKMGLVHGSKEDYAKAFQYLTNAAGQGDAASHYHLSSLFWHGKGVEKDINTAVYHWEEAAIGGHPDARFNLGVHEWKYCGIKERALKHFIIAAYLGEDNSMKALTQACAKGFLSKDDYAAALRAYQAAADAMKSPQREAAYKSTLSAGMGVIVLL